MVAEGEEAGGAFAVAERVAAAIGQPYRVVVLGHVQRGGRPTARDRIIAAEAGAMCVHALCEGRSGLMVGRKGGRSYEVPLADVVRFKHPRPEFGLLQLAQELSG